MWRDKLVSSQLLEYEVWNRVNALGRASTLGDEVRALLARIDLVEMARPALIRALDPWPVPLRTLDSLHLATAVYLDRSAAEPVELASYDNRLIAGAQAIGMPIAAL